MVIFGKVDKVEVRAIPKQAPLSILHIVAPGWVGGCERVVQGLAIGHRRRGHDVRVAAVVDSVDNKNPFIGSLENNGVVVYPLILPSRAYKAERRSVRDICLEYRPSVVHTHGYRPDVLDASVARSLGIPTVTTEHGASKMGGKTRIYEWLQLKSFRKFDAVIAVSYAIAQTLPHSGVEPDRIHVIQNAWMGTDAPLERDASRRLLGLPVNKFIIGWVGRLIPAKGCDVFLRAIAQIEDIPLQCIIIGDGPERKSLESLSNILRLGDRVSFRGQVEEAGSLFSAFDLFVLSSHTEGTPIVLFESGAAGVPVIATRVGGVLDMLTDQNAYLVPSGDASSIAGAIQNAYSDMETARQRADNAKRHLSERFSFDAWLERYEEIYRLVLNQP